MVLNGTAISRATDDAVKPGILAKKRAISSNLVDFLWARSKFRNNRSIMTVRANTQICARFQSLSMVKLTCLLNRKYHSKTPIHDS